MCCLPGVSVPDGGATWADAGTLVDAAPRVDAHVPSDAATDARAADAAVAGSIACGTTLCDASTEGCLASCLYATDERMPACIPLSDDGRSPGADCPTGRERFPRLWLTCDGAEDCPTGQLCHMLYGSLGQYAYCAACDPPCDLRHFNPLCRSDADCPAVVPTCTPNADLPGYSTCE